MNDKIAAYPFHFKLNQFTPDRRQWKPSMPVISPRTDLFIEVNVPMTNEFIANNVDVLANQLDNNSLTHIEPVLTLKGFRYIIDQFETVMSDPEPEFEDTDEIKTTNDDEEW